MTTPSTTPPPWIAPFWKILEQEKANGFNDRTVMGGLDAFMRHWAERMTAFLVDAAAPADLAQLGYSAMTPAARAQWVAQWNALLEAKALPPTPVAAPPPTLPAESSSEAKAATDTADTADSTQPTPADARPTQVDFRELYVAPDTPAPTAPTPVPATPSPERQVDLPVSNLRRVNAKLSARLEKLGITTIRDLLYHFPHRHQDYSQTVKIRELRPGLEQTVVAQVLEAREVRLGQRGRLKATEAVLSDDTGSVKATWFGQAYLARNLKPNTTIAVSGRVEIFQGRPVFESPEYEFPRAGQPAIHTGRLAPVYPLTAGLTSRNLRSLAWQALEEWLVGVAEFLPSNLLLRHNLMPLPEAIRQAHYPDSLIHWERARRRLAFDELLTLQLSLLARRRRENQKLEGIALSFESDLTHRLIDSLPFALTGDQRKCIAEIEADLRRGTPAMNRLLQGEVGSGKTVVALAALLAVIGDGYQGAIMAPTEVLAEQHFHTVSRLLGEMGYLTSDANSLTLFNDSLAQPITVGLLTGNSRARPRRKVKGMAAEGTLSLLIGTHAIIQEDVKLPKLALAVMDEQHRFGVMQRSTLRQKSAGNPHILVMSATPIPRTLTLTLYGDLEISSIKELPPGRQEIQTRWLGPDRRLAAYGFIQREVQAGRQAFIVCPLIDESEDIDTRAAKEEHRRLSEEVFPELRVGLLHGRMSGGEKDRIMRRFRDRDLDILVTTAVVEVGIDVPNATVMLIEGADRFGLSQLHQFRGRVGRGEHKSYCILMSDNPSVVAQKRLDALEKIRDGFELAEVDLDMRGPGDFFGTRQSGLPNLRLARISDRELLELTRREANVIIESDPELTLAKHAALAAQVSLFTEKAGYEFS